MHKVELQMRECWCRTALGTHLVEDDRDDSHEQPKAYDRHPGNKQQLVTCNM